MTAVEVALRFVLDSPYTHTAIPATSNIEHLEHNCSLSDGKGLAPEIVEQIRNCYQLAKEKVG
jgi:aryl-alcohol dehydrogenase-like predicted oxidoreductase